MTIDDAIIVLKWLHNNDYVSRFMIDEVKEATNIAIEALEQIKEKQNDKRRSNQSTNRNKL